MLQLAGYGVLFPLLLEDSLFFLTKTGKPFRSNCLNPLWEQSALCLEWLYLYYYEQFLLYPWKVNLQYQSQNNSCLKFYVINLILPIIKHQTYLGKWFHKEHVWVFGLFLKQMNIALNSLILTFDSSNCFYWLYGF